MRVVITDFINIGQSERRKLEKTPDIKIYDDTVNEPKAIIERIKDAEIATANFIDLTEEIINNSPKLKYIISPAKGFDWIDAKAAANRRIRILNCPTFNAQAVAEHAVALMFSVKRKILNVNKFILNGNYDATEFVGSEVGGKLLVTVGHGEIGKRILKMSKGLGMKVAYADSKTNSKVLDGLISKADILVLCLPLNDSTREIIDGRRLGLLKRDSILVNVARGLVVEQQPFYKILKEGKITGAGIDTFPKDETIKIPTEEILNFAKLPNVVATPHIAYNTLEAAERLGNELIANIESCLNNKPINVVI